MPDFRNYQWSNMLTDQQMNEDNQPTLTSEYIFAALGRLERAYGINSATFAHARATGESLAVHEDDISEWDYLLQAKSELEVFVMGSYYRHVDDADRENVAALRHCLAA